MTIIGCMGASLLKKSKEKMMKRKRKDEHLLKIKHGFKYLFIY
jgi:hypothetical protein